MDIHSFRWNSTPSVKRLYMAGITASSPSNNVGAVGVAVLAPWLNPYSLKIGELAVFWNGGGIPRTFRLGIYGARSRTDFEPSALLFDSGDIVEGSSASKFVFKSCGVNLPAATLCWFCLNVTAGTNGSFKGIANSADFPLLGWRDTGAFPINAGLSFPWTSGPLPSVAPSVTEGALNVPCIWATVLAPD